MSHKVRIQLQDRKSLAIKVVPGGVVVLIPRELAADGRYVRDFIEAGLRKLPQSEPIARTEPVTTEDVHDQVTAWSQRLGVEIRRTQVRTMRTKWASCSSKGTLTLSTDVLRLPGDLVDYIICHELLHLRIPDHGRGFRAMIASYLPDWRERERRLAGWALWAKNSSELEE